MIGSQRLHDAWREASGVRMDDVPAEVVELYGRLVELLALTSTKLPKNREADLERVRGRARARLRREVALLEQAAAWFQEHDRAEEVHRVLAHREEHTDPRQVADALAHLARRQRELLDAQDAMLDTWAGRHREPVSTVVANLTSARRALSRVLRGSAVGT